MLPVAVFTISEFPQLYRDAAIPSVPPNNDAPLFVFDDLGRFSVTVFFLMILIAPIRVDLVTISAQMAQHDFLSARFLEEEISMLSTGDDGLADVMISIDASTQGPRIPASPCARLLRRLVDMAIRNGDLIPRSTY
jgi:hypothetical protein